MQVLTDLARLWAQTWDTFFAAAISKVWDWRESELMDTTIVIVRRELPQTLTWDTDSLVTDYIANGEKELQIRRRLVIFIVGWKNSILSFSDVESIICAFLIGNHGSNGAPRGSTFTVW
jgi:hypothetical protein